MYDGIKALTQHANSKKHIEAETAAASSQRFKYLFSPKDNSQNDSVINWWIVAYLSWRKAPFIILGSGMRKKIIKLAFSDSQIAKNVTVVVQNVFYPFSIELVIENLKNNVPFSILTDASNKGNRKLFTVAVQYYSLQNGLCFKILDFYEDAFEDSRSI